MTYPPASSGYPSSQQPTTQFSAPTQHFGKVDQPSAQGPVATAAGPSKLPFILLAAIAVSGVLVYLFSFGPQFKIESTDFPQLGSATGTSLGLGLAVVAALLSALIAGASLLPNQKAPVGIIAAVAVLSFLLVIAEVIQTPEGVSLGWALYVVIFLTLVQAGLGIGALLLDAGIISAPVSKPKKPKYEQPQQYGQYGAPNQYYGQPGQLGQPGPHQGAQQQRPPYPGQYGGGYSGGASPGGGYAAVGQQNGPPTPPTGFPTYGQPQATQSAPTGQTPAQPQPQSSSSSNQSGNSPS